MFDSKKDILALVGAAGAGVATILLLRRALREEQSGTIPNLKLPPGCFHPLQAWLAAGKDNLNFGTGRLILQGCDPKIGVAKVYILGSTNVLLRDPNLVQEVLRENRQAGGAYGKSFRDTPIDPMIDNTFGRGLFFAEDQDKSWAVAHKILSKPFSHRSVLAMLPTMCEQADKMVAALDREAGSGRPVYLYDYMVKMALETIAVCSMGTPLNCFSSEEAHPLPTAFNNVMEAMMDLLQVPPPLWFLCWRTKRRMQRGVLSMRAIIDDIVQKRLRGETQSSAKNPDLLDIMLCGDGSTKLDPENIRGQISNFLFAGHDSTAAAMSSLIVFLQANPRVEERVIEEIRQVVGDGEELQAHHLPKLTYLDWCLKETLRLLPPAGNYQRMAFEEGLLLGGTWRVGRFEQVIVDIFALHMDPETWGANAAEFVPERWEKDPPHPYSYQPFASGPRGCIGKEFSLIEQKVVAVKLLQHFVVKSLAPGSWRPREGSVLIKASEPFAPPIIGIDAEINPRQFFAGASVPVTLQGRTGRP